MKIVFQILEKLPKTVQNHSVPIGSQFVYCLLPYFLSIKRNYLFSFCEKTWLNIHQNKYASYKAKTDVLVLKALTISECSKNLAFDKFIPWFEDVKTISIISEAFDDGGGTPNLLTVYYAVKCL